MLPVRQQSLTEATVVMITDGRVDRGAVDIVTGQTVFFAVVKGPGISITDASLLEATHAGRGAR